MTSGVVVVGAGQAGVQLAASLREAGYGRPVMLIGDEPGLPYQRPPLSKAYLLGKLDETGLHLRADSFFRQRDITVLAGRRATRIDRARRCLDLDDATSLSYDHLVLATGARNRSLRVPGAGLHDVLPLRSLHDARQLRAAMDGKRRAVVIGAGFIGMEFAAVATATGLGVTVLEAGTRVMARSSSPEIAEWFQRRHEQRGVRFRFGTSATAIEGSGDRAAGVVLADGTRLDADLVLVAVGVVPNVELAAAAGLPVGDGIEVDQHLLTSDPAISAIGDCASGPSVHAPGMVRLESVQNAVDQAKSVAARLCGRPAPYVGVPWFWSDQGADKLQIAGLVGGCPDRLVAGDREAGRFSVLSFRHGVFVGAESVHRPTDHMAARRLLQASTPLAFDQAAQPGFDLATFASARREAA